MFVKFYRTKDFQTIILIKNTFFNLRNYSVFWLNYHVIFDFNYTKICLFLCFHKTAQSLNFNYECLQKEVKIKHKT